MNVLHRLDERSVRKTISGSLAALLAAGVAATALEAAMSAREKQKAREEVLKETTKTLELLYKVQPKARKAVESSAGHAAFSNFGLKVLFVGSGKGEGVAVDGKTKAVTFMRMLEVQAGLGVGIKTFRVVFVFETESALKNFIDSGWEVGGQLSATAKVEKEGVDMTGALSVSPGVWMYQLTDNGLAAELVAKGTKYYRDDDLN